MSVWPAWGSHSGVNSSQLNADDTQQHLEFLLCDPWNQSHSCASLTRRKKEVGAPPPKPNLIGIAKFPPAGYSGPHSADICSVICQPSLIECTFTSDIVSVWPGCTLPRLISVYIIEGLRPATGIRKHRPSLVEFLKFIKFKIVQQKTKIQSLSGHLCVDGKSGEVYLST